MSRIKYHYLLVSILCLSACNRTTALDLSDTNEINETVIITSRDTSKPKWESPQKYPSIILRYPFKNHGTFCTQGNKNFQGSHSHENILYAVDFLTPPENKAGLIYASHEGVAYVYNECSYRKNEYSDYNDNDCGGGYGNHVRILHPDGYMTIYAHLSNVTIEDMTPVKAGEVIGVEGISGSAGKRHLHFGLHIPKDTYRIALEPGYTGESVPFFMELKTEKQVGVISSMDIPCDNNLNGGMIEGVNNKTKGAFTSENALLKQIYYAIKNATKKWSKPMHNWATIIPELDICP